ncbi:hypothetical protein NKI51_32460, partial [Mesorhizobium australicum]
ADAAGQKTQILSPQPINNGPPGSNLAGRFAFHSIDAPKLSSPQTARPHTARHKPQTNAQNQRQAQCRQTILSLAQSVRSGAPQPNAK